MLCHGVANGGAVFVGGGTVAVGGRDVWVGGGTVLVGGGMVLVGGDIVLVGGGRVAVCGCTVWVGGAKVCVGVDGVAEGVPPVGGVGGDGVSLALGVAEGGVALGPVAEADGEGCAGVDVRDGVTPGRTVAEGMGGVEEAPVGGGVTDGETRVAVGGTTLPGGT